MPTPDEELLSAYLDGEVTSDEQQRVERRLADDAGYRQLHDELRALRHHLEALPSYRLEPNFSQVVLDAAERQMVAPGDADVGVNADADGVSAVDLPRIRRWIRPLVWTALTMAAALLLAIFNPEQRQPPRVAHVGGHVEGEVATLQAGKQVKKQVAPTAGKFADASRARGPQAGRRDVADRGEIDGSKQQGVQAEVAEEHNPPPAAVESPTSPAPSVTLGGGAAKEPFESRSADRHARSSAGDRNEVASKGAGGGERSDLLPLPSSQAAQALDEAAGRNNVADAPQGGAAGANTYQKQAESGLANKPLAGRAGGRTPSPANSFGNPAVAGTTAANNALAGNNATKNTAPKDSLAAEKQAPDQLRSSTFDQKATSPAVAPPGGSSPGKSGGRQGGSRDLLTLTLSITPEAARGQAFELLLRGKKKREHYEGRPVDDSRAAADGERSKEQEQAEDKIAVQKSARGTAGAGRAVSYRAELPYAKLVELLAEIKSRPDQFQLSPLGDGLESDVARRLESLAEGKADGTVAKSLFQEHPKSPATGQGQGPPTVAGNERKASPDLAKIENPPAAKPPAQPSPDGREIISSRSSRPSVEDPAARPATERRKAVVEQLEKEDNAKGKSPATGTGGPTAAPAADVAQQRQAAAEPAGEEIYRVEFVIRVVPKAAPSAKP